MKITGWISISVLSALGVSSAPRLAEAQTSGRRGTILHPLPGQSVATASASVTIISPVGIRIKYISTGKFMTSGRLFPDQNSETQYIADGEPGYVVAVSLPDQTVMTSSESLHTQPPRSNLSVNDIHTDIPENGSSLTAVGGGSGELSFRVAAETPVPADTPAGLYTGSLTVTVNYN